MADDLVRCQYCWRRFRLPVAAPEPPRCGFCAQALPWITRADEDSFADAVALQAVPVVVEVRAEWSGPCRLTGPVLERIARERAGLMKLVRVDVDQAPALPRRLAVAALPTLVVLRDGDMVARRSGAVTAGSLRRWIGEILGVPVPERELVPG